MEQKDKFIDIIKEHQGIIFKIAAFYSNCPDDRDDLRQEIVYQLWKSFDSFKGQSKISTWIYRVAMNASITNIRKNKRQIETINIGEDMLQIPEQENDGSEERIKALHQQIQQLSLLERGIVLLYLEGKNQNEIAEITGLTRTNVGTRFFRIKEKLKTRIKEQ